MDLADIAEHDLVSAAAAKQIGIDGTGLRQRLRAGQIRRVIRGWYAVWSPGAARPPWEGADTFETARRQHRLLVLALLKSFEGRVVASHQSTLVLRGIPTWRADLEVAHLCRTSSDHTRHHPAAVIHPPSGTTFDTTPDGFDTVPVAHAVVQVGLYPPHEPALRSPMDSLVAADFALHNGQLTHAALETAEAAHSHHPGIGAVRAVLEHADGRHESPGETRLAHSLRRLGYTFTPQVPLPGGYFGDFGLDDRTVVIEFDGLDKYELATATAGPGTEAARRQRLVAEKRREEDVIRRSSFEFARFTWPELDDLALIRDRVEAARARAGRQRAVSMAQHSAHAVGLRTS
jgi:hypothetical protein